MALVTVEGYGVTEGIIRSPKIGAWVAELALDTDAASSFAAGTKVTISVADRLELKGAVRPGRTGEWIGSVRLRIVGGAGGLAKSVAPKFFSNAVLRDPLGHVLQEAGESLAASADATTLAKSLRYWTVIRQLAGPAIGSLALAAGASWRVLADGTVWMGPESWPAFDSAYDFDLIRSYPNEAMHELGVDAPILMAGYQLADIGNLSLVEHHLSPDRVRSYVWTE